MKELIRRKIMDKKVACKSFKTINKSYDAYLKLQTVSTELSEVILKRKDDYHRQLSDKFNDPKTSARAYQSTLKTLYNGKKASLILLILVNNELISKFKEKVNHFNAFFGSQCIRVSVSVSNVSYHPFNSKSKMFLIFYSPLTIIKPIVRMIYL